MPLDMANDPLHARSGECPSKVARQTQSLTSTQAFQAPQEAAASTFNRPENAFAAPPRSGHRSRCPILDFAVEPALRYAPVLIRSPAEMKNGPRGPVRSF